MPLFAASSINVLYVCSAELFGQAMELSLKYPVKITNASKTGIQGDLGDGKGSLQ